VITQAVGPNRGHDAAEPI